MYALDYALIATPIGMIRLEGDERTLARVQLGVEGAGCRGSADAVRLAEDELQAYFSGYLRYFSVPLPKSKSARGGALRQGLLAVGYGETVSYGGLARRLESGARAIGQLCARNPLPIIVPCHRVIGANGVLGRYSAGDGSATKQWLLDHERRNLTGAMQ